MVDRALQQLCHGRGPRPGGAAPVGVLPPQRGCQRLCECLLVVPLLGGVGADEEAGCGPHDGADLAGREVVHGGHGAVRGASVEDAVLGGAEEQAAVRLEGEADDVLVARVVDHGRRVVGADPVHLSLWPGADVGVAAAVDHDGPDVGVRQLDGADAAVTLAAVEATRGERPDPDGALVVHGAAGEGHVLLVTGQHLAALAPGDLVELGRTTGGSPDGGVALRREGEDRRPAQIDRRQGKATLEPTQPGHHRTVKFALGEVGLGGGLPDPRAAERRRGSRGGERQRRAAQGEGSERSTHGNGLLQAAGG